MTASPGPCSMFWCSGDGIHSSRTITGWERVQEYKFCDECNAKVRSDPAGWLQTFHPYEMKWTQFLSS